MTHDCLESTLIIPSGDFEIRIFDDSSYRHGSADNVRTYDHAYFDQGRDYQPHSKHGIVVQAPGGMAHSAILLSTGGGATGIHKHMVVTAGERLFVCGGNSVFALSLPSLSHQWRVEADRATCFGVYAITDGLIVRGEVNISRLSINGEILWQFSGRDIFVTPEGEGSFQLGDDFIEVTDWNYDVYRLDYDGNLLRS